MLGRNLARLSRSSNAYVCLACQTKQLQSQPQTLLYSTTTAAPSSNDGALPVTFAGRKAPKPPGTSASRSKKTKAAEEAKTSDAEPKGRRRRLRASAGKDAGSNRLHSPKTLEDQAPAKPRNKKTASAKPKREEEAPGDKDFWSATLDALKRPEQQALAKPRDKKTASTKLKREEEAFGDKDSWSAALDALRNSEQRSPTKSRDKKTASPEPERAAKAQAKAQAKASAKSKKPLIDASSASKAETTALKSSLVKKIITRLTLRKVESFRRPNIRRYVSRKTPLIIRLLRVREKSRVRSVRLRSQDDPRLRNRVRIRQSRELKSRNYPKALESPKFGILKQLVKPKQPSETLTNETAGFTSLEEALSGSGVKARGAMDIKRLSPNHLDFTPIDIEIPPVPTLSHGLDRVLFNPGVYHLQDPRSRVYNFDPYLEKIMPATEFDFDALGKYMTSSKDQSLINMAKKLNAKFTGSTSSMTGALTHFHYLLSQWRELNLAMLSQEFPDSSKKFSKIQRAPSAIFLRWKDGTYAIDADKEHDTPNIMSWLGQSMEVLLTNPVDKFERYRRSSAEETPDDDDGKCFHYTQQGNILMRSQLDAKDPRLPGTGVFDLKTRAVVSVRMDAKEFEHNSGYQIKTLRGEWESFEREYYDMIRATMLKYSLQVRMGRMDGIFVAYHNVERIFGFQYVSKADMDLALHGQEDPCLGDQEFKLSVELLSKVLDKAAEKFPEQSIRLHFETRDVAVPFMYIFAEPVAEEQVESIQNKNRGMIEDFERRVVGLGSEEEESMRKEWSLINTHVEKELEDDQSGKVEIDVDDDDGVITVRDDEAGLSQEEPRKEIEDDEVNVAVSEVEVEEDAITDDVAEEEEAVEVEEMIEEAGEVEELADREPINLLASAKSLVDSLDKDLPKASSNNILGLTLTIRNKLNGAYVPRPARLQPDDEWAIEYSLSEIPDANERAWRLYEQLKARRAKALVFKEDDRATNFYMKRLAEFSSEGRAWREQMDARDKEDGVKIYTPLGMDRRDVVERMGPWGRDQEKMAQDEKIDKDVQEKKVDVEVEGAEDYMEWLYRNLGSGKGRTG